MSLFKTSLSESLKSILYRFMLIIYVLKMSWKSVNVAIGYKRLKLMKIAVFYDFRPISEINLYFCSFLMPIVYFCINQFR